MSDKKNDSHTVGQNANEKKAKEQKNNLDDILKKQAKRAEVEEPKVANNHAGGLEQKITSNNQTIFERFFSGIFDGAKTVTKPFYTAGWMIGGGLTSLAITGVGPLVMSTGLGIGRYFINKKIGKPFTFTDFKHEYLKGLVSGNLFYPIGKYIATVPDLTTKLLTFYALGPTTFIGGDKFTEHYITNYGSPSALLKGISEKGPFKVLNEGLGHAIRETPKTYASWIVDTKGILPIVVGANWASSYSMPLKYTVSTGTASAYRFYTEKAKLEKNGLAKGAQHQQMSPQSQQALMNQYLANNPQYANQMQQQMSA